MSRVTSLIIVALLLYVGGYVAFRQTHIEVWDHDKQAYVIFPDRLGIALYYFWRPLSYVDGASTKIGFHIGPHQ
jgi:hypothetical protein